MQTRSWSARGAAKAAFLLVPDDATVALQWAPFVRQIGAVTDAHVLGWDAPRLAGRSAVSETGQSDVDAAIAWVHRRWPGVEKLVFVATGSGLDRLTVAVAERRGAIVVSLTGSVSSAAATAVWRRSAVPWLFCAVGAVEVSGEARPVAEQPTMLLRRDVAIGSLKAGDQTSASLKAGPLPAAAAARTLGWLFAML